MSKFYVTTPIYYANAAPHLGHAYTTLLADAIARQRRLAGDEVFFLTGTDEHGDKIEEEAARRGVAPETLVDETVERFRALWKRLSITPTDFIRTTEERHVAAVRDILARLHREGHFYQADYTGWFCTPCERFWTEKDLAGDACPDCKRPVHRLVERNYFFRMGRHREWLVEHIRQNPDFIQPESRRNEVLGFLAQPLGDLCISRPRARLSWGIPLPFDADYVTYVWFDALLNYITAIGYPFHMRRFLRWWPADLHLIGKDILTTHAVYWPTMLRALDLPPPRRIFAHGWWLSGGEKMSKSRGNIVNPMDVLERHGPDPFRFFLLREMNPGQDAVFTPERFETSYNADLANNLGNLASRALAMIEKYAGGTVPAPPAQDSPFARDIREAFLPRLTALLSADRPDETLAWIWDRVDAANRMIETRKPWALAKRPEDREALAQTLYDLAEFLRLLSVAAEPFLPEAVLHIRRALGLAGPSPLAWGHLPAGETVRKAGPLFPRIG